ncbi:uncharacterized protein [Cherax quadricarinatus]|uniref:uncharacterized protein isoform X2 n=1 Tax=Cherax quadricarinatus TaxID=27406 RepID=UPI00387EB712
MAVITKEENNGFRIMKAVSECGRRVLHHTFCWGTPDKPATTTLDHYLNTLKQTSSANYLQLSSKDRKFNKTQKKLINRSANGREFDVPLLCRSIKLACENVAPLSDPIWITASTKMEYYITAINNMRNDAAHGPFSVTDEDYYENMRKLRELLTGCLKTSGKRYGRDQDEVTNETQQMNDELDHIMNEILGEEDIIKYCSDDIKQIIIKDSYNKLKEILQQITYINPVYFITNNFQLEVDQIFVDIEVKKGRCRGNNQHIDYVDLLSLVQTTCVASCVSSGTQQQGSSGRPQILLLEGVAGSGKTTLVKLLTDQWIQGGQGNIKDLDNYDLLLWIQCRNPTINSYQGLLDRLIPDVSTKFRNMLPKIIKLCKVIIIVDGLDELNNNSRTLVKSLLLEFQNSIKTTFICTSRPEAVEMFSLTIPEGYDVTIAELRGIKEEHTEEFVRRTHQEITKLTNSNRNTNKLVNKVMVIKGFHEHLRLPMNLTFFVYILNQEPDELNIRTITQTQLYHKIHHMSQSKLLERLTNCSKNKVNESTVQNSVQEILKIIYARSLESLSRDQLSLEEETVEELISVCNKHDIPYHEILSAFLSLKPIWTWQGIEERYSAPHKGIQDYFSALHIVMTLKQQLQSSPLPVLIQDIMYTQHPAPPVSSQPSVITVSPPPIPPMSSPPHVTTMSASQTQPSSPVTSSQTSPISTSPSPAPPTPASPTPALPTPAPPTLPSPTPAPRTPAPPTPAPPTQASPIPAIPVSIRGVLEESIRSSVVDMNKYQNVLTHVAGLLHLVLDQVPEAPAREVVHLLQKSGVTGNKQWLDLLDNTMMSPVIVKQISHFFNTEETIVVLDEHVRSCAALLPHLSSCDVRIDIRGDPGDLPDLPDLLAGLTHHHCTHLLLHNHYLHADTTTTSDNQLQRLQHRNHLETFVGCLTGGGVNLLQDCHKLWQLHLAVVSDHHAGCLLPQLHHTFTSTLHQHVWLSVRVSAAAVSAAAVTSLPSTHVVLELTDVSDDIVSDACDLIQKLQPPGGVVGKFERCI